MAESASVLRFRNAVSPNPTGDQYEWTAAELAAWPLHSPYLASRTQLWIDFKHESNCPGMGWNGAPRDCRLIDRASRRVFRPISADDGQDQGELKKPIRIESDLTTGHEGKPAAYFGLAGKRPLDLSKTDNGHMKPEIFGTNNSSFYTSDMAWTLAFKLMLGLPDAYDANGVYHADGEIGGAVLGAQSTTAGNNAVLGFFDPTDRGLRARNKSDTSGYQRSGAVGSPEDMGDGVFHDYIMGYNPTTNLYVAYIDGTIAAETGGTSGWTQGIETGDANALLLHIAGTRGDILSNGLVGLLAGMMFLPTTGASDAPTRTLLRNVMAEW